MVYQPVTAGGKGLEQSRDVVSEGRLGVPLRALLVALASMVLAPGLLFAAWYANSWAASERSRIEHAATHIADGILAALDRQIASRQGLLTALATSPSLQADDIEKFYHQAVQITRELGVHFVLRDVEHNKQVFHTSFAFGQAPETPLPALPTAVDLAKQRVLASGKPQVSGAFLGRRLSKYVVLVMVPVLRGSETRYILSANLTAESIANVVGQFEFDPTWIAAVIDKSGIVVAQSRRQPFVVGEPLPGVRWDSALLRGDVAGTGVNGEPTRFFFARSEATGWRVTVGVPERALAMPSKWALGTLATASILILLMASALAHRYAGRLSNKLGALQTVAIVERKLNEEQFHALAESVSNGFIAVDDSGKIMFLNAQVEIIFGYSRDELIGRSIDMLVPERYRRQHVEVRRAFAIAPRPRVMGSGRALTGLRKDGTEFPIKVGLSSIDTNFGRLNLATMADLTAQNQAKEHLSAILVERDDLRRRLMQAQEHERLRLARDLHDQTGQVVAAAMMELKGLEPYVDDNGRKRIHHLRGRLDKMGKALHRIAWELRPASIDEVGLVATLTDYVEEWSSEFGVTAEFFCNNKRINHVSDEVSTTVYRVVQEALTNTAKHARGATAVSVIIDFSGSELRLTIEDNGCGFDAAAVTSGGSRRQRGLGLDGVRERLSLIGGEVDVESTAGTGTTLFIRIPLEPERMIA